MSNTQYAVCHLQRGSGNDSGMSCHIERKDAKGKKYVPNNADAGRTPLNRELVRFPDGVSNRTEAVQHRIDTAGLRRKVGKNQTKAIRIILTGTHELMMKIANDGRLDNWIDANLKWLRDTFGDKNLVSCVLHMDEKTPHLHATVVPIVTGERVRRKRRTKLHEYQNSYAAAMKPLGLQRGIVGSTAKHQVNSEYYKQQVIRYEEDIAKLQADVEKAQEYYPCVFRKGRPCQSKERALGQGRRDCRTQQAAQGASGRKGAVAGTVQVGNREAAGRLPEGDRGSHPQGGSRRTALQGEECRHRQAEEADRPT